MIAILFDIAAFLRWVFDFNAKQYSAQIFLRKRKFAELSGVVVRIKCHYVDYHEDFTRHICSSVRKLQPTTRDLTVDLATAQGEYAQQR